MTSYIMCQDCDDDDYYDEDDLIDAHYDAPFDMEVNSYEICVYGSDLSGMKLRGNCDEIVFNEVYNYNDVDLSGFMDLEIGKIIINSDDKGLLKILELKCKTVWCLDEKIEEIMNKYLEEIDPLMRDIQGCKYELAVNGYGDRL